MSKYFIVMRKYFSLALLVFFLLPQIGLASEAMENLRRAGVLAGLETDLSPTQMVARTINAILGLVGSIFIILIIWAGFRWLTSAGNTDQVKKSKDIIINSVIGLAIIVASYIISYSILQILVEGSLDLGGGMGGTP